MRSSYSREQPVAIEQRTLSQPAIAALHNVVNELYHASLDSGCIDPSQPELVEWVNEGARTLPQEVTESVRLPTSIAGAAVVTSEITPILPLDSIGPTPQSWREARDQSLNIKHAREHPGTLKSILAMLVLSRATGGEPQGWENQQFGQLVNHVVPVPGQETVNSGASSTVPLTPHSEDSFHPERPHQLILGCLRNNGTPTTIGSLRAVDLSQAQEQLLTTATLPIFPDVSYSQESGEDYTAIPIPTFGHNPQGERDYLRIDSDYTPLLDASPEFQEAYLHLMADLARVALPATLQPGQFLLINNGYVVHGRPPFTPLYDRNDRWLLRTTIRHSDIKRPTAEATEHGYGQKTVRPFA